MTIYSIIRKGINILIKALKYIFCLVFEKISSSLLFILLLILFFYWLLQSIGCRMNPSINDNEKVKEITNITEHEIIQVNEIINTEAFKILNENEVILDKDKIRINGSNCSLEQLTIFLEKVNKPTILTISNKTPQSIIEEINLLINNNENIRIMNKNQDNAKE